MDSLRQKHTIYSSLNGTMRDISQITSVMEDRLFAVYSRYYENISRDIFSSHLREKEKIILLKDRGGIIQGFSTLKVISAAVNGETLHAVFSGDTIIEEPYRRTPELVRIFSYYAGQLKKQIGDGHSLYWFLISKGYKTYRFLPLYARRFYPTWREPFPEKEKRLLDAFAGALFPGKYNPATGLITFQNPAGKLRAGRGEIPAQRLTDPDISFFSKTNPDHMKGVELACITELSEHNLRSITLKYFVRGCTGEHEHVKPV
ncbi:MAG: hypothetical protein WCQ99_12325 [Pseudomonadota bacterium]